MSKAKTSMGNGIHSGDEKSEVLRLDEIEFDPGFNSRKAVGAEAEATGKNDAEWSTFVESFDVNAHQDGHDAYTLTDSKKPMFSSRDGEPVTNGSPTLPFAGIKQDTDVVVRPNARKGSRKAFSAVDGFRRDLAIRSVYKAYGVPVAQQTIRAKIRAMSELDAIAENVRSNQDRRSLTDTELTLAVTRYTDALTDAGYVTVEKGAIPAGVKAITAAFISTKLGISRSWAQVHLSNAKVLNERGGEATDSMRTAIRETSVDIPVRTIAIAAQQVNKLVKDGKVSPSEAGDKLIEIARGTETVQRAETRKKATDGDVGAKWDMWKDVAKARGTRLGADEADGLCTVNGRALTDPNMAKVWGNVVKADDVAIIDSATNDSKQVVLKAAQDGYNAGLAAAKEAQAKRAEKAKTAAQPSSAPKSETKGKGKKGTKNAQPNAN